MIKNLIMGIAITMICLTVNSSNLNAQTTPPANAPAHAVTSYWVHQSRLLNDGTTATSMANATTDEEKQAIIAAHRATAKAIKEAGIKSHASIDGIDPEKAVKTNLSIDKAVRDSHYLNDCTTATSMANATTEEEKQAIIAAHRATNLEIRKATVTARQAARSIDDGF